MTHPRKPEHLVAITHRQSKSVLNRSGMGGYTLNPYVGCPVGCAYCLEGNTLIAMADGTTKPIKDVLIGETIVGVRRQDHHGGAWSHCYTQATILNKIETVKEAFEIVLENNNRVICSGDHRWPTERGWKYTIGNMHGPGRRPYLTANNFIKGIGQAHQTPPETEEYSRGYLAGMIRSQTTVRHDTRIVEIKPLGKILPMFDITTSTENFIANGLISHNCYVPHMAHKQTETRAWGSYVEVKDDAAKVLAQQLKRLRQPTRIFMSSATDPYQPAEEQHRITRTMLEVFLRYPEHALHILTKQPLVERDADLLTQLPRVAVGMSFSTLDDHLSSIIEPWAPVTSERLAVIRRLSARGIATYLLWAPAIVPAPMPEKFVAQAIEQIAQSQTCALSLDALNYRARQSAGFERRLAREGYAPATKAQVALLAREAASRGLQHRLELPEPALPDWATPMLPF